MQGVIFKSPPNIRRADGDGPVIKILQSFKNNDKNQIAG